MIMRLLAAIFTLSVCLAPAFAQQQGDLRHAVRLVPVDVSVDVPVAGVDGHARDSF